MGLVAELRLGKIRRRLVNDFVGAATLTYLSLADLLRKPRSLRRDSILSGYGVSSRLGVIQIRSGHSGELDLDRRCIASDRAANDPVRSNLALEFDAFVVDHSGLVTWRYAREFLNQK